MKKKKKKATGVGEGAVGLLGFKETASNMYDLGINSAAACGARGEKAAFSPGESFKSGLDLLISCPLFLHFFIECFPPHAHKIAFCLPLFRKKIKKCLYPAPAPRLHRSF